MKINIITRCTRTSNLLDIKENVFSSPKGVNSTWHIIFDTGALKDIDAETLSQISGKNTKLHFVDGEKGGMLYPETSALIETFKDGWIYLLDDDNILHEDFYVSIKKSIKENPDAYVHLVSQQVDGKDFTNLDVRIASPENTAYQKIDIAQMVLNRRIFDTQSFSADYAADGFFIEKVYSEHPTKFVWINNVLSHYNYLQKDATAKIPKILYIGDSEPDLKSEKFLSYEADELDVKYLKNDDEVYDIINEFKPDAIVTDGNSWEDFPTLASLPLQFRRIWYNTDKNTQDVGSAAYNVSMNSMLSPSNLEDDQMISFFTPIYNTGQKLWNTYASVRDQTYSNWEWVIVNDSTDGGKTLKIAEEIQKLDPRVKVYDFREKSGGCIGESKYRCCALAKGYILAELDHDDLLVKTCAEDLYKASHAHPECGFFYGDTAEVNEEWVNNKYEAGFALGYGNYRDEEYEGRMLAPANQQNINPKTIRHIVGVPNHIRAWRRSTYFEIGGHNRSLTIADDFELVIRSFLKSKICRIPKLSYIQFLYNNAGGRNTHDLSRADIQRRVRTIASYYNEQINARFLELGLEDWAYDENPEYPIAAESRYGDEEGYANVIYKEDLNNK
jgi:glycosyltransferase involved in cell wall biosynthesis|tara:strand:- start:3394 stop:5238 length:1845 start_codon:yes stop_codon:yes gene_type:complete